MKKFIKKTVSLLLAAVMVLSMVACGNDSSDETSNEVSEEYASRTEVKIKFWRSGLGEDYLKKIVDAFNEKQTEYYVTYSSSSSMTAVLSTFGLETEDETDIYMGVSGAGNYLEPLDDVVDSTIEGEGKTLREKLYPIYLEMATSRDGHIYQLTGGGGNIGIVYNKELFKKAGIEKTPRTTDELIKACSQLRDQDVVPFIHFTDGGYWTYYVEVWQAQYDGYDYWKNNWCMNTDLNGNSPSKEVFTTKDGRYEVLEVLEDLIAPDNIQSGSNSLDHVSAQTMLLNSDIGMMVTGTWITKEMEGLGAIDNYGMMKNPVISSITDKLTTVNSDMQLREVVDAIDAVTDGTASIDEYKSGDNYMVGGVEVSAADWDYVMTARNMIQGSFNGGMSIPNYSTEIDGAKEFMKFFFSDEGYKLFAEETRMGMPMDLSTGDLIDTSEWDSFAQEQYNVLRNAKAYIGQGAFVHDIFINGGATAYATVNYIAPLTSRNADQNKTADELWQAVLEKVDLSYDSWIKNIE